jgi:hypothetical protein
VGCKARLQAATGAIEKDYKKEIKSLAAPIDRVQVVRWFNENIKNFESIIADTLVWQHQRKVEGLLVA